MWSGDKVLRGNAGAGGLFVVVFFFCLFFFHRLLHAVRDVERVSDEFVRGRCDQFHG